MATGPYRFLRHPIYVGVALELAGFPLNELVAIAINDAFRPGARGGASVARCIVGHFRADVPFRQRRRILHLHEIDNQVELAVADVGFRVV